MTTKVSSPASVPMMSRVVEIVDLPGHRGGGADLAAHDDELLRHGRGAREIAHHVSARPAPGPWAARATRARTWRGPGACAPSAGRARGCRARPSPG